LNGTTSEEQSVFGTLDVGCGAKPKGDVNIDFFRGGQNPQAGDQIRGEFMTPRKIRNFIVADAMHLPIKSKGFEVVLSSHTIEHVQEPLLMLREMCRAANKQVAVRFPHRKGSGAVMPYHVNFLDEGWFRKAADILGWESEEFVTKWDYPISSRLRKICPVKWQKNLYWSALEHLERLKFMDRFRAPFEIEVWLTRKKSSTDQT
jgi:hypothetical protein